MAWIFYVVTLVVAFVAAKSMQPKPQAQPPVGLSEYQIPTAEEGREIPVLFGTRDLPSPNILWYGGFRAVAVRKKP